VAIESRQDYFSDWLRRLIRIEGPGIRTALAAVVPIVVGQLTGYRTAGAMVALGGLYVSTTDKEGASVRSLAAATLAISSGAFIAALAAQNAWSAILLVTAVSFGAGLMYAFGDLAGQIGFATALVCAVEAGSPAHAEAALERMGQFALGGMWAALLTCLLWRWEGGPPLPDSAQQAEPEQQERERRWKPEVIQHAIRLAVAAGVAVSLYRGLGMQRGYWLILTVLVIMKPELSATRQRAVERVVGSLVGGALAVLVAATVRNVVAMDLLLVAFAVLAYSHLSYDYGLYTVFLTPFVILLVNMAQPGDWHVALVRIYDTVFGGALAWIIAILLRPRVSPATRYPTRSPG
jgi:uncharacterized membrane protein YccC